MRKLFAVFMIVALLIFLFPAAAFAESNNPGGYQHYVSSGAATDITESSAQISITYTVDAADTNHTTSGECLVGVFLSEDPNFYLSAEGMDRALFRPTVQNSPAQNVTFVSTISGLNPGTTYYYRAKLIDKASTDDLADEADGGVKSFTTLAASPAVYLALGVPVEGTRFCFSSATGGLYSLTSDADSRSSIKVKNSQSVQIAEDYRFSPEDGPLNTIFFAPAGEMLYIDASIGSSPITLHLAEDAAPALTLESPVTTKGSRAYCFTAPEDGSYTITASGTMGVLGIANMDKMTWDNVQGNLASFDLNKGDRVYMKWNGNPTADVEYTVSRSIVMDEIEAVDQNGDIRAQMQAIYANDPNGVARVMKTNDPDVISTIRGLEEMAAGGSTSITITPETDNKIADVSILGAGLNSTADGGPAALVVDKPQGQHNVPAADQFRTLSFSLTLSNVSSSASLAFPIAVDLKLSSTGVDRNQLTLYHFHADGTSEQVPVNVYADPSGAAGEWYAKIYLTGLSDFVMVYSEEGGGDSGNDPVVIDSGTCGAQGDNVTWTLYDNGEMVIEGSGKIADRSFRQWSNVKSVTINDGVTSIGEYVFWECSKLSSVSIPKSVASIGGNSFAGCGSLTSIHVDPDNTAYCDSDEVLYNRDMSTLLLVPGGRQGEFVIPGSVKSIGEEAFYRCAGLTGITIPDSVSAIDTWAFGFCSGLTNMTIPAGVKSISDYSFCWCTGLQTVSIPSGVTSIGDNAFGYCYELERVIIPENVTSIGAGAFLYCRTLTSVTIPNSVTDIQGPAFALCSNLASIHVASDNPAYCDSDGVLYDKNMSALYQVPCAKSGSYVIPNDVAMISNMAFSGCSNITSIAIPESVTSIGNGAFVDCSNLTDAYYTGTQEQWNQVEIGLNNDALTSANIHLNTIPDLILPFDVTTIGDEAFAGGAFVYPLLSENTVSIGQRAFADCPSLAYIYIPEATESIDSTAFGDKTALMIYGKAGSTAEVYAAEHNFLFTAVP